MTLLLVSPPFTDPTQPGAALPSLAAALRERGESVEIWDLNLDAWEYLLAPARQAAFLERARRSLRRLERLPALEGDQRGAYLALAEGVLRGNAAAAGIAPALEVMRTETFFDAREYRRALHAIESGLALVSAVFHPTRIGWGRCFPACPTDASRAIVREAKRPSRNPFFEFARTIFTPRLRALAPEIVGISVTYLDQIVPTITLAAECRRARPSALVVLGGQIVSAWGEDAARGHALWRFVDVLVQGEGESALAALVTAHRAGAPLDGVQNVVLPPRRGAKVLPRSLPPRRENLARLPCPDYDGLPLRRYLSPEPVLTVSASRGCYWGRCAFCAVSPAFRDGFRIRPTPEVMRDLERLGARHGVRLFTFGDDALPREFVGDMAEGCSVPPGVKWQAELRWEALAEPGRTEGLARAGACNLIFGLESGSEEVLRLMRKGASLDRARRVLASCARAGIGVNLQCFLGFPGETRAQAAATLSFLNEVAGPCTTVSCGLFELQKGSPIWRDPGAHGIRVVTPPAGSDLPFRFEHRPHAGRAYRTRLITRIIRRATALAPQLQCGISAHSLVYLAHVPVPDREPERASISSRSACEPSDPLTVASGASCHVFAWDPDSLGEGKTPRRRPSCLAFSLEYGRVMALGEVASTLMHYADGATRLGDLLPALSPRERRRVRSSLRALVSRGILRARLPDN